MKALTFNQYRIANIILMTILFSIAETLIVFGARKWFPGLPYTLSLNILFMSLELIRWRGWGAISAVAGGLVFCLASQATAQQFAIYCAGNLLAVLILLFVKLLDRKRIRTNTGLTVAYVALVFLLACVGRFAISLLFGAKPLMIVQFVTTDFLSFVFALVAILAVRSADGIFEDQKDYLFRLERERKERTLEQEQL